MSTKTPNINTVIFGGNVVADPEIRKIGDKQTPVTTLTIANNRRYQDRNKEWQEVTAYVDVELWGPLAEKTGQQIKKGTPVIVEGTLKQDRWEDKNGNKQSRLLIKADRIHILS